MVAVAEEGSVTRAAAVLHQSPSSISHMLAALEAELGVTLFHRLSRGMVLTDAGETFVEAARRTLHDAEVALRSVDAIRGLVAGHVSIAAKTGFATVLADLIGDFSRRYPEVAVRAFPSESTDTVAELVRGGVCDLAITWNYRVPDDLEGIPILAIPSVAVVPKGHPLAGHRSICVADLGGERIVAPLATSRMRPAFDALFHRHGVQPRVVADAATNEMVLELVRAGVGCTVTVEPDAALVAGRGAVILEIEDQASNEVLLLMRTRQEPTPAARAFRDLTVERFAAT